MSSSIIASPIYLSPTNTNDGAENSPSFSFKNSPLTGIFRVSHDTLGISTAGVKRIQVNPNGNTIINGGVIINSGFNADTPRPDMQADPQEFTYGRQVSAYEINSRGDDEFNGFLILSAGSWFEKSFISLSGNSNVSDMNKNIVFGTGGNERMRITSTGAIVSLPTYDNSSGIAANLVVTSTGEFRRSTSSLKYKKDIQDAVHGLSELLQLRPVTYKSKREGEDQTFGGFIAEEVHAVGLNEFVQYAEDGSPDALSYANMVSLCVKAIQELSAKNEALEARLSALENK